MAAPAPDVPPAASPPRRKGPPAWGIVLFLVLLGGMVVLTTLMERSGPAITWFEGDLDAAFAAARKRTGLVFLYLYDPENPIYARNEQEVFTQRWAREPLANVVCLRRNVRNEPLLAARFQYDQTPLFLLLDTAGQQQGRVDGIAVDERQFFTQIGQASGRAAPVQASQE